MSWALITAADTCSDNCRAHAEAEAEAKLADLIGQMDRGTFVEATRTTLVSYLRDWVEKTAKPTRRPETYRAYRTFVETHIAPARLAQLPLQKVRKSDLEHFYNTDLKALAPSSVTVCHAVISKAMHDAVDEGLLQASPAERARNRRKVERDASTAHAQQHCWSAAEAGDFLAPPTVQAPRSRRSSGWRWTAARASRNCSASAGMPWTSPLAPSSSAVS